MCGCGTTRRPSANLALLQARGVRLVGPERRARWPAANSAPAAWPSRWRSSPPSRRAFDRSAPAARCRTARAGHRRPDARADRPGALHRQPLLRQAGPCHRRGAGQRRARETTLVSGPTHEPAPPGVKLVRVETAREMLAACEAALPADVAVWPPPSPTGASPTRRQQKIKKGGGGAAGPGPGGKSRHPGDAERARRRAGRAW